MNLRRRFLIAVLALVTILVGSTVGYLVLGGPGVTVLQAVYMAVITLSGVGYGEIIDTTNNAPLRIFNIFVVFFGVATAVYVFSIMTAFVVEGEINQIFSRRKMQNRIDHLSNHYLVCGLGDTGRYVLEELQKAGTPFVVIDLKEEALTRVAEQGIGKLLYVIGDATEEETLIKAGLARARGLIAALPGDKENLVITLIARQNNSKLRIVTRCTDLRFHDKLLRAGANSTVSPNRIGGLRLASEVIRPHVVSFLDLMLKEQSRTLRIEEIEVGQSSWVGKRIDDLPLKRDYNLLLLSVRAEGTTFWTNPPGDMLVQPDTVLIVMGDVQ
ncbi:MAG: NAD-binding protein, partial [Acidobacteria bacterium]|nr:NAD-binding protein [Acidobacteriota bacterium]